VGDARALDVQDDDGLGMGWLDPAGRKIQMFFPDPFR
jgi:hypothetical protein